MAGPPVPGTSPQQSIHCEDLVVTRYANLPGGSIAGAAFAGVYTCTGLEDPAGFPVVPPDALPASYAVVVQPLVRAIGGALAPAASVPGSFTAAGFNVSCNVQPLVNDVLVYIVAPT